MDEEKLIHMQIQDEVIAESSGSEEEDSAVVFFRQPDPNHIQIQVGDNMLLSLKLTDELKKKKSTE